MEQTRVRQKPSPHGESAAPIRPVCSSSRGACLDSSFSVHQQLGGFDQTVGIRKDDHYLKTKAVRYDYGTL